MSKYFRVTYNIISMEILFKLLCKRRNLIVSHSYYSTQSVQHWTKLYHDIYHQIRLNGIKSLEEKYVPVKSDKGRALGNAVEHFVDFRKISAKGGDGGNGLISFMSFYANEFAGPGGGDGGNGGHVIFQASRKIKSLNHIPKIIRAENGEIGGIQECAGKNAPHLNIQVPVGTIFKQNEKIVGVLEEDESMFVGCRGGAGGKGNVFFKCNVHKAPSVAEYGGKGEHISYDVELKMMADIGLIGFPNAGKSTFLRAISRARPKVASYPFTTLNPHVGVVQFTDDHQMSVADIPGLIEGAHKNRGLGFSFLRHIERCNCLLYVIDASVDDPYSQLSILRNELEKYEKHLSEKPHAIVANKIDLPETADNVRELQKQTNLPIVPISAKMGRNIVPVLVLMRILSEMESSSKIDKKVLNLEAQEIVDYSLKF